MQRSTDLLSPQPAQTAPLTPHMHGLRGLLAVAVLLYHSCNHLFRFIHVGFIGVDVFFVLSGYAIMVTYGREMMPLRAGVIGRYLWLRVTRVWPMLVPSFLLCAAWTVMMTRNGPSLTHSVSYLLFADNWVIDGRPANGPTWSLRSEFLLYCAFPLIAAVFVRSSRWMALLILIATVVGEINFLPSDDWFTDGIGSIARTAFGFVTGCALACVIGSFPRSWSDRVGLGCAVGAFAAIYMGVGLNWLVGLAPCIVAVAAMPGRLGDAVLNNPASRFLGRLSYPVYVLHYTMMNLFRACFAHVPGGQFTEAVVVLAVTLPLCATIEMYWERPMRRALRGVCTRLQFGSVSARADGRAF